LKEIGEATFRASSLKSIRIPNNVEKLGDRYFHECNSLIEVTFESESKLKEIGEGSFAASSLKSIRIPNNVEKLGDGCFRACKSLIEVTFESESKLKEIGEATFRASSLKSIRIPNSVEKLGDGCCGWCESLIEVTFESESKLKEIGRNCFERCALECVRLRNGFNVEYNWPKECRIEYFIPKSEKLNISDYVIDLGKEYEFVKEIGEVELWRKLESSEEVAVKTYNSECFFERS
jgi:hypothetical protein